MSLLMTLIKAPRAQPVRQMRLEEGQLVIGRSAEADWRIDDPDQYVSRAHCTISGRDGAFSVTDTSSGGLFVDGAHKPLGSGRSVPLSDGMRLRLGDYVVQIDLAPAAVSAPPPRASQESPPDYDADAFFSTPSAPPPRPERPRDLPDPFERTVGFGAVAAPPERHGPPAFDDPFTLDPPNTDRSHERPVPPGFDWDMPASAAPSAPTPPPATDTVGWEPARPLVEPPATPTPVSPTQTRLASPPAGARDAEALAAFLRGLGVDPADLRPGDPLVHMEAFGREYRMMAEGLMQLLRMRAEEKGNARIAQTVVSASRVNPFKFMPTVDDALAVLTAPPSGGFADADAAIAGAVRDLAGHQVKTWRGTQAALRRMIDRFSPDVLEKELEALGLLETLLAGGRRAKLWELYQKRFCDIAQSAETRFLGEVGADFREAYETEEE